MSKLVTKLFVDAAQTAQYVKNRPTYPGALFQEIKKFAGVDGRLGSAVDVACGSGQAILGLASMCDRVTGMDVSEQQLQHAPRLLNTNYTVGDAHALPLEAGSQDLVTVAQALHWFDRPRFYREAARVLRPRSGVLAVWSYDAGHVATEGGPLDRVYQDTIFGEVAPYWDVARKLVDDQYRDMEPLEPFFTTTARVQVPMQQRIPVEQMVGYAASWSAFNTYAKQHPGEGPRLLDRFRARLQQAALEEGVGDGDGALTLTRTITLLMGKGPKPGGV